MTYIHLEGDFSSYDGLKLFSQSWIPEQEEAGIVILLHGLGEHSGRYAHVGRFLAEHGYSLRSFDLRGHGRSAGMPGDIPSYQALMQDIGQFHLTIGDRNHTPLFLFGHSLGALLAIEYVISQDPVLNGLICTGLPLKSNLENQPLKILAIRLLAKLLPHIRLPSGLDPRDLSSDQNVVREYLNDPLVHDRVSLILGAALMRTITSIRKRSPQMTTPLMLMHGEKDQLAYPSSSVELAKMVSAECTVRIWDGMLHEIHNEQGKEVILLAMLEWLQQHTK